MNSEPESVLVRFLTGKVPIVTSFWLVFAPVYLVLVVGARPLGSWWGGLVARHDLPFSLLFILMFVIGLVVSIGAFASAWRSRAFFTLAIVGFVSVAYLFGVAKAIASWS